MTCSAPAQCGERRRPRFGTVIGHRLEFPTVPVLATSGHTEVGRRIDTMRT